MPSGAKYGTEGRNKSGGHLADKYGPGVLVSRTLNTLVVPKVVNASKLFYSLLQAIQILF